MTNVFNRFEKSTSPQKALKWAISIILPSLILFGANQVLVTWNLSNLLTAVEKSESSMNSYSAAVKVGKPAPGVENEYWSVYGMDIDYVGPRDKWARENIVPAAVKFLPELKSSIAELEGMKLLTFDQGMKLAKVSYLNHAKEWRSALEAVIVCVERKIDSYLWRCIDDYYYYGGSEKISRTWDSAKMEFARISPMFSFYSINSRISKVFGD